jgi:outer membrane protein assembly factor BamB
MRTRVLFCCLALTAPAAAGDWPQFLGPNRDGVAQDAGPIAAWDASGPKRLWQHDVGAGYAGPVVLGDRLVAFAFNDGKEVIECLEAKTGKPLWKYDYASSFQDGFGKGKGPRATPVLTGDAVVTLGADGWLHALDLKTGAKRWGRNIVADYSVPDSYFGIGASPLVVDGKVLVNVGAKTAGIVAFDLADGKELWKATGDGASYASPIVAAVEGAKQAVFFTRHGPVTLDPATGKVLHAQRWRARYDASVNAATPLVVGEHLFFSTTYETGALILKLRKDGADEIWSGESLMDNHYNTSIAYDGALFGIHGRQEAGASLRCVDLKTKKVLWNQDRFGCASMARVGGQLLLLTEKGELVLADADRTAYQERARARIFDGVPVRAQIAVADGRLYARDKGKLACYALK